MHDDELAKWIDEDPLLQGLREVGKLNKAISNGKTYMANPKALTALWALKAFFKKKSDHEVKRNLEAGISDLEPYTFHENSFDLWMKSHIFIVTADVSGFSFTPEEMKTLMNICGDMVAVSVYPTPGEKVSISFHFNGNFYVEQPQQPSKGQ